MQSSPEQKKESESSPWKEDRNILDYGPSPFRPSPQQRRWYGMTTAIFWAVVLLVVVLAFVVWALFFR